MRIQLRKISSQIKYEKKKTKKNTEIVSFHCSAAFLSRSLESVLVTWPPPLPSCWLITFISSWFCWQPRQLFTFVELVIYGALVWHRQKPHKYDTMSQWNFRYDTKYGQKGSFDFVCDFGTRIIESFNNHSEFIMDLCVLAKAQRTYRRRDREMNKKANARWHHVSHHSIYSATLYKL